MVWVIEAPAHWPLVLPSVARFGLPPWPSEDWVAGLPSALLGPSTAHWTFEAHWPKSGLLGSSQGSKPPGSSSSAEITAFTSPPGIPTRLIDRLPSLTEMSGKE